MILHRNVDLNVQPGYGEGMAVPGPVSGWLGTVLWREVWGMHLRNGWMVPENGGF